MSGSPARTRTTDPMVNSHLLYRLSYWGMIGFNCVSILQDEFKVNYSLLVSVVEMKNLD